MTEEKTIEQVERGSVRSQIIAIAIECCGDWNKIMRRIEKREIPDEEEVEKVMNNLKCEVVTILDEEYPQALKQIRKPPFVLFYYGDLSLVQDYRKCISVVGTRHPTEYGRNATKEIVVGLNEELVVVSGMAIGIDATAHYSAIASKHKTVAVLGSGVNVCYPSFNKKLYEKIIENHLVISEYPPDVLPVQEQFPIRNRIVAGLSKCLLVTEAKRRSGTTTTMAFALEAGRDVLCVPSNDLNDSACNLCIKDGGFLVENSDDVNALY